MNNSLLKARLKLYIYIYIQSADFLVKHIQFIVKNTFKATCFGAIRAIIRPFCKNRTISNYQYMDMDLFLQKGLMMARIEPKHVALNVF
jgi:hypothetical protein